jgi:hypothetical protein
MSFKVGNHGKKFEFSLPINQRRVVLQKKKNQTSKTSTGPDYLPLRENCDSNNLKI